MKARRRFAPAGVAAMDQNRGLLSSGIACRNQENRHNDLHADRHSWCWHLSR